MKIIQSPSPNFSKSYYKLEGSQIHKTLGNMPWTLQWLQNPKAQASAHYLITRKGAIHQLVQLKDRPWSSGRISKPSIRGLKVLKKRWGRFVQPGHYLMQVEFECLLDQTFTQSQYKAYVWLVGEVLDFPITNENLLTHKDTAIDKPELEKERTKILQMLAKDDIILPVYLEKASNEELLDELKKRLK